MLKKTLISILAFVLISCGGTKKDENASSVTISKNAEPEATGNSNTPSSLDTTFLVQELEKNVYLLNLTDTIFLEKPYIKLFTGEVGGRDAQLWLTYSLPSMEGLCTRYVRKAQLYIDGDKNIHHFVSDGYVAMEEDDEPPYDYDYSDGDSKITIKTENNRFILNESSTTFTAVDAFAYANVYCDFQDMIRSHWSYLFDFEASGEDAAFFAEARLTAGLGALEKQKNNIKTEVLKDVQDDDDMSYCYTMYDHTITQPLYLDSSVYVIATYSDVYMGGAHGIYGTSYYNIDRKTGELLTLEDILDVTNEHFIEYYKNKLMEEFQLGSESTVEMPSDFFILPSGIWLHYPPYSLNGGFWEKEMFLPYYEIENYLRWREIE